MGVPKALVEGFWGACSAHRVQSPGGDPPQADAIHYQQGHQAPLGDDKEFPHLGEDYQGVNGGLPPPLRVETGVLRDALLLLRYML